MKEWFVTIYRYDRMITKANYNVRAKTLLNAMIIAYAVLNTHYPDYELVNVELIG